MPISAARVNAIFLFLTEVFSLCCNRPQARPKSLKTKEYRCFAAKICADGL